MLNIISNHVLLIMVMSISSVVVLLTAIAIVEVVAHYNTTTNTTNVKREKRVQKNSLHRRQNGVAYIYVTQKQNKISRRK